MKNKIIDEIIKEYKKHKTYAHFPKESPKLIKVAISKTLEEVEKWVCNDCKRVWLKECKKSLGVEG